MPKDNASPILIADDHQLSFKLKDAHSKLKSSMDDYLPARQKSIDDRQSISGLYEKIRQESSSSTSADATTGGGSVGKLSNYHRSKLKTVYNNALKNAASESERLRRCLDQVHEIRRLKEEKRRAIFKKQLLQSSTATAGSTGTTSSSIGDNSNQKSLHRSQTSPTPISSLARAETNLGGYGLRRGALMMLLQRAAVALPLWIGDDRAEERDDDDRREQQEDENSDLDEAPPLCGAVPAASDHVCQPGDMVAVRAKVQEGDENWILAEVKKYDHSTGKYEVEDIDEEQKERYVISKKKLIPLPRYRAHPQLNPSALFEVNAVVWALYPQTTCFYKGVVERRPAGPNDPYLVAFEDSSYPNGYSLPLGVQQRYVIAQD